jgi:hypothetical protein
MFYLLVAGQCKQRDWDEALDYAIRTENWELAALCLVVGALEALEALPPDAVDELIAELDVAAKLDVGAQQARARDVDQNALPGSTGG